MNLRTFFIRSMAAIGFGLVVVTIGTALAVAHGIRWVYRRVHSGASS